MLTSYDIDSNGDNIAYPKIQQPPGQNSLRYFSSFKDARNLAEINKETINMGKDRNFAEYYTSVGTKLKQRPEVLKEAMNDYIKNTNIMKLIPKHQLGKQILPKIAPQSSLPVQVNSIYLNGTKDINGKFGNKYLSVDRVITNPNTNKADTTFTTSNSDEYGIHKSYANGNTSEVQNILPNGKSSFGELSKEDLLKFKTKVNAFLDPNNPNSKFIKFKNGGSINYNIDNILATWKN